MAILVIKNNDYPTNISICIVIYNLSIDSSPSFNSLYKQLPARKIFVFDNSTSLYIKNKNIELSKKYKINYQKTNNNGLGVTFNLAINKAHSNCEFIGFFDQDTNIPGDYIQKFYYQINNRKIKGDVFVPYVKTNNKRLSPIFKTKIIGNKKNNRIKSAINSGMLVRTKVFSRIKFNEELFLDYIDHDFFRKLNMDGTVINVLPVVLKQDFSDNEKNLQKSLKRFESYWNDTKIYCKIYGNHNYFIAYKHALKLSLRYKSKFFLEKVILNEKG